MHMNEAPIPPRQAARGRRISERARARSSCARSTRIASERFADAAAFRTALEATPEGKRALGQRGASGSWRKRALVLLAALLVAAAAIIALRLR